MDSREWRREGAAGKPSWGGSGSVSPSGRGPSFLQASASHLKNESHKLGLFTAEGRLATLEILREVPWAQLGEGLPAVLGANSPSAEVAMPGPVKVGGGLSQGLRYWLS